MGKIVFGVLLSLFLHLASGYVSLAQAKTSYLIENLTSNITINQDASLDVEETIEVVFTEPRHGIFRNIPVVYRMGGKTINSKLTVVSVRDQGGLGYRYETMRQGDNIQIKIGDADTLVSGRKIYKITYRVRNVLARFDNYDELYWNVAGSWDTEIANVRANVTTDFADIEGLKCFSGYVGTTEVFCESLTTQKNSANFISGIPLGVGKDLTIVVALKKENNLNFSRSILDIISDYGGYFVAIFPLLVIFFFWFNKGRDSRFREGGVYYEPENGKAETVPIFGKREYLPLVYSPIAGLTPSEVGTLADDRIDIHDVVAEIAELGRLGFLKIEKLDIKLAPDDFLIKRDEKPPTDEAKLRHYQKYLLDSLFTFGKVDGQVKLSELKTKFYKKLDDFREMLYQEVHDLGYFSQRPDKVRAIWIAVSMVVHFVAFIVLVNFFQLTYDFWPFVILFVTAPISFILAFQMPKKTAKGYSLFRQVKGLAFYLGKGKWRQEIAEKHLFLEETLPLAISLGVVTKLASDMQELGIKPPSYFDAHGAIWASSFTNFNTSASSVLVVGSSTSGSWSGGSGFSGGSSGGGFGGGGGGSW